MQLSKEWVSGTIGGSGKDKDGIQKSLRKKKSDHLKSATHLEAEKITHTVKKEEIQTSFVEQQSIDFASTCNVFRTAYYVAKNDRPYSDHSDLLDLQKLNGVKTGRVLHSNVVCADIIDHIAAEMKQSIEFNYSAKTSFSDSN